MLQIAVAAADMRTRSIDFFGFHPRFGQSSRISNARNIACAVRKVGPIRAKACRSLTRKAPSPCLVSPAWPAT
ncbi:hypothetical protein [Blastomonas sp. SL216]|uniref:hypothetical protein n=1 Tax=Blastomonas sp. SL216 TaxID=2995169 RepID=UPI0023773139|nr:hypothetical protein OU999_02490 [Blastomonas sp. SL216]